LIEVIMMTCHLGDIQQLFTVYFARVRAGLASIIEQTKALVKGEKRALSNIHLQVESATGQGLPGVTRAGNGKFITQIQRVG
jgi:hypothetical protein